MRIYLEDESHEIDVSELEADLKADGYTLKTISHAGEIVIDDITGEGYISGAAPRRAVWQAISAGSGADNTYWGNHPGGYEFCRSVKLEDAAS